MIEFEAYGIALIPVIVGLVSIMTTFGLSKRYAPIVSIVLGIIAAIVYIAPDDVKQAVLVGITIGLAASGLYSSTKHMVKQRKTPS
ncbi:hypothetical protein [Longirhabdus pacifica]|uniref:hypothetical protein n=1 Tax=Longirhabdus pacifica TaxID=2305227 RepID=UPI001008D146|nr:hypothetical protein [Longirhabdus pacifica]